MPGIVLPGMDTISSFSPALSAAPGPGPGVASLSGAADAVLWVVQGTLAGSLVVSTVVVAVLIRTGRFDASLLPAVAALSARMISLVGLTHVLGGLGLVLPQLTGVLPWLTPVAGLALAVQVFMASGFHLRAGEEALEPALWGVLCVLIAVGRIDLLGVPVPLGDLAFVVTLGALLLALAANLVVLLRGPRNPFLATSAGRAAERRAGSRGGGGRGRTLRPSSPEMWHRRR